MQGDANFFADPAVIHDPHSYFADMRGKCPIMREPHQGTLMVTGFDEALEILTDRDGVFSNACSVVGPIPGLPFTPEGADIGAQLDAHRATMPWADHLVCLDGKTHTEQRLLIGSLLTHTRLRQNEAYLQNLADGLIDDFIDAGTCDVMPQYAHATTTFAISDLMGIPVEDRAALLELIGAPPSQVEGDAAQKVGPDPLVFLKARFDGYLRDRIETPRGDLMSELVQARYKDGSAPSFETLSNLARFLFGAGQDTTSRLIAMAMRILAEDQPLQSRLRAEPAHIVAFVEEVLRYDAPVKVAYRLALRDTKVGDVEIPAGTILTVGLTAASRDPRQFEEPDAFDIDRPRVRNHMGFSRGAHGCIGAPLGRMESRIAIERLLARTSHFWTSDAHHGPPGARSFRFEQTYTFRSLSELHIELEPAGA